MKKPSHKKNGSADIIDDVSSVPFDRTPDTPEEMINAYGTYEIQPTADTDNEFPAIAQGNPPQAQRDKKFYRGKDRTDS